MIVSYEDLPNIRKDNNNRRIVLCIGTFDLTHVGHILFFEDCKKQGDILVVAVGKDSFIKKYKGHKRPILNEKIRMKTVDSLKTVDYVFLDKTEEWKGLESHEETLGSIFDLLKPDVYVVNEEGVDLTERKRVAEKRGVKFVILPRYCPKEFEDISTTKIVEKIRRSDD